MADDVWLSASSAYCVDSRVPHGKLKMGCTKNELTTNGRVRPIGYNTSTVWYIDGYKTTVRTEYDVVVEYTTLETDG